MIPKTARKPQSRVRFFPREHGATAMLFTPIVCAAILARAWHWSELAVLAAAFAALAAKDPMVVLARQRYVWKQQHEETAEAARWFLGWMGLLALSGVVLLATWPIRATMGLGLGVAVFSVLAIAVNVKNKQRSTLFQIASALALTSSSLAMSLSAIGKIAPWCWLLWLLMAAQATTGILVVHARLDAKIAAKLASQNLSQQTASVNEKFRRAAIVAVVALVCVAIATGASGRVWIAAALLLAAAGYTYDLRAQRTPASLDMPLTAVGQRALALSCVYAALLIVGLW